jgi:DNA-binding transcriptional LysR family regulator
MNRLQQPTPLARLLRAAEVHPAAVHLTPAVLLALQAFDVAYRLGSFRAAAHALHLTPSAVSHRIRSLEKLIGEALFVRKHRTIEVTRAGRMLAEVTGHAFSELARVAGAGKAQRGMQRRLRLAVATTFATSWLIPRLSDFLETNAGIEVIVENVTRRIDFENEPYDAAINSGTGDRPGLVATELVRIFTTPVCTPATRKRHRLESPTDLRRVRLIQVTSYPLAWPLWFERAGVDNIHPEQTLWVDDFRSGVDAARHGAGVALALEPLLSQEESVLSLVRPFAIRQPTGAYWLIHRPADSRNLALRAFKRWLSKRLSGSPNR